MIGKLLLAAAAACFLPAAAAAAIVSSTIVEDAAQRDGRRCITERHVDQLGKVYLASYITAAGADVSAMMAARVSQLNQQLIDTETESNIQRAFDQLSPVFSYSAQSDLRAALRERYKNLSGWDAVRLGAFINGLGLSDGQLTALFGVSGAQLTALKTKLSNQASKYAAAISEGGQ